MAFLNARLDEDEQVAREAIRAHEPAVERFVASRPSDIERMDGETAADWSGGTNEDGDSNFWCGVWAGEGIASICQMDDEQDRATAEHIARHDPARVLADVAAKRAIVEAYAEVARYGVTDNDSWHRSVGLGIAVRSLASVYADHPDYDLSWTD